MRELARHLGFGKEAAASGGARQQFIAQYFDRDFFVFQAIACGEHSPHAAVAEHGLNLIATLQHHARADHDVRALMGLPVAI